MADYDPDYTYMECHIVLKVRGDHEGELTIDELESIDEQMEVNEAGNNLATRIDVDTTSAKYMVTIEYVVQTTMLEQALHNKVERLEHFTVLDDPFITVGARAFRMDTSGNVQ